MIATKRFISLLFCLSTVHGAVDFTSEETIQARNMESQRVYEICQRNAHFYALEEGQSYRNITTDLLDSEEVPTIFKQKILESERQIIVFTYLSDGYKVKGYLSYTPEYATAPLLVFLRGGNRILGLMNPANDFSCHGNYTVLATTYRGGVSEGSDEFGGAEVRDIKHLVDATPQLEKDLQLSLHSEKKFILGGSRGGLEMLLALQRFPELQSYFDKAVALSGPMDLQVTIDSREQMKQMFIRDFGFDSQQWLEYRSPIHHCETLEDSFPLLLIQGTQDHRTHLDHGRRMTAQLKKMGKNVTYWEIEDGTHCLSNHPHRMDLIAAWLEDINLLK